MLEQSDQFILAIAKLRYALACHIPVMKRRVRIHTGYGSVEFHGPQARKITALCEDLLQKQLARLEGKDKARR
jgi:hypothetical protein